MESSPIFAGDEPSVSLRGAPTSSVVLVGPKAQFPDCLCRVLLSEIDGCRILRLASLAELAAARSAGQVRPQLVIVDDGLWQTLDDTLLDGLRMECRAVVAVAFRDSARVRQLAARHRLNGPVSFLPMDLNIQSWLTIVRLMLTGYPFVPTELAQAIGTGIPPDPPAPPPPAAAGPDHLPGRLTPRENEVLDLIARGLQNKHIAERLGLSEHTVKLHVHNGISKLGATNRTDAAMRFRQLAEG